MRRTLPLLTALCLAAGAAAAQLSTADTVAGVPARPVVLRRTPEGGIQPQAALVKDTIHLIYFKGDPRAGDVFYVRSTDDGATFTRPLRVNSQPGSVIAIGNVRGAHLAVTRDGQVHVAWMGSATAMPKAPGGAAPMLYTRLNADHNRFEPQRNVIQNATGLDGGGSIAAAGNHVVVAWHAPEPGAKGEANRRVWLVESHDGGKTYGKEQAASPAGLGVCGCCGLRAFIDRSSPAILYRAALDEGAERPTYWLHGDPRTHAFRAVKLDSWKINTCPMSTAAIADASDGLLAAWETRGQVYTARVPHDSGKFTAPTAVPGVANGRKHPALAVNGRDVLVAWTEGMGWSKGGAVAWQIYGADGRPRRGASGRADGVPAWSLIAAVPSSRGRGQFVLFY